MAVTFQKATKKRSKLRAATFGPSGSGKTFTALRIAAGLGGRIAFIDTEFGSASKYSDRFTFDVLELKEDQSLNAYIAGISEAARLGYDVLIIDSMTHGWQELLAEIDRLSATKYGGNKWAAWSEGTPKQNALVKAFLSFPGHIIATMRSKTEWRTTETDRGKIKPVRVGLAPEERAGFEYEFDLLLELTVEHFGTVIKDRTGKYQDAILDKPGEDFGKALAAWLAEGEPEATPASAPAGSPTDAPATAPQPPASAAPATPTGAAPAPPETAQTQAGGNGSGAGTRPVVFPFGKFKGQGPQDLTYEQLRHELDFWQGKVNDEPEGKFAANNKRILAAVTEALAAKIENKPPVDLGAPSQVPRWEQAFFTAPNPEAYLGVWPPFTKAALQMIPGEQAHMFRFIMQYAPSLDVVTVLAEKIEATKAFGKLDGDQKMAFMTARDKRRQFFTAPAGAEATQESLL